MSNSFSVSKRMLAIAAVLCMLLTMIPNMPFVTKADTETVNARPISVLTNYKLYVGQTQVLAENAIDNVVSISLGSGNGTAKYYELSSSSGNVPYLELNNAVISGNGTSYNLGNYTNIQTAIYSTVDNLQIIVKGNCSVTAPTTGYGLYCMSGTDIGGDGTVLFKGAYTGIYANQIGFKDTVHVKAEGGSGYGFRLADETDRRGVLWLNSKTFILEAYTSATSTNYAMNSRICVAEATKGFDTDQDFTTWAGDSATAATQMTFSEYRVLYKVKYVKIGHEHKMGAYLSTATQHYQECSTCRKAMNYEDHQWGDWISTDGGHYHVCSICQYSTKASPQPHTYEDSYTGDGHNRVCSDCKDATAAQAHEIKWVSDGKDHWQACDCGYVVEDSKGNHTKTDCTDTKCDVCDAVLEAEMHTFEWKISEDGTQHCQECSVCGYTSEATDHTYSGVSGEDGTTQHIRICDCGKTKDEDHVLSDYINNFDKGHYRVCSVCQKSTANEPHTPVAQVVDGALKYVCADGCGYIGSEVSVDVTVNKNMVYSGVAQTLIGSVSYDQMATGVNVAYAIAQDGKSFEDLSYQDKVEATDAGTYTVVVRLTVNGASVYKTVEATIAKCALYVIPQNAEIERGADSTGMAIALTLNGFVNNETAEQLDGFKMPTATIEKMTDTITLGLQTVNVVYGTEYDATANYEFVFNIKQVGVTVKDVKAEGGLADFSITLVDKVANINTPVTDLATFSSTWYNTWVEVAPNGSYTHVTKTLAGADTAWSESFTINRQSDDAVNGTQQTFYLLREDGVIATATFTYRLDYTPADEATLKVGEGLNLFFFKISPKVTVKASDAKSGLDEANAVQYYVHNIGTKIDDTTRLTSDDLKALAESAWTTLPMENGEASEKLPKELVGSTFVVYVRVTDRAGNVKYLNSENLIIDETAPEIYDVSASTDKVTNKDVTVTVQVEDVYPGIDRVEYCRNDLIVDGVWPQTVLTATRNEDETYSFLVAATADNEGQYEYIVRAYDMVGNVSEESSVVVHIDITPPAIAVNNDYSAWTAEGHEIIGSYVTDARYTVKLQYCFESEIVDGVWPDHAADAYGLGQAMYDFACTVAPADYVGNIVIRAWDEAGNYADELVPVKMDNSNPTIDSIEVSKTDWTNQAINVAVNTSDLSSGVVRVEYCRENQNWETFETVAKDAQGNVVLTIPAQDYEGKYLVRAIDGVGKVSEAASFNVKMDVTKPTIENATAVTSDWTNQLMEIGVDVQDSLAGIACVEFRRADQDWTSASQALLSDDGSYLAMVDPMDYQGDIVIRAFDYAGNASEEFSVSVKMDITKPSVTAAVDCSDWTNGKVMIDGKASDELSGVQYVEFRRADEAWPTIPKLATLNEDGSYTFVVEAQDYEGDYVVRSVDNAGNKSTDVTVGVKMDITASAVPTMTLSSKAIHVLFERITFGFYQAPVTVTVSAADLLSGNTASGVSTIYYEYIGTISKIDLTDASGSGEKSFNASTDEAVSLTFELPAAFYGTLKAWAIDEAGNLSEYAVVAADGENEYSQIIVDQTAPDVTVSFSGTADKGYFFRDQNDDVVSSFAQAQALYTNGDITATIVVTEDHFYAQQAIVGVYSGDEQVTDGVTISDWASEGNVHTCVVTIAKDGEYTLKVSCLDYSGNEAKIKGEDQSETATKTYASKPLVRDTVAPSMPEATLSLNNWTNDSIVISGNVQDDFSGVVEVVYKKGEDGKETTIKASTAYNFEVLAQDYQGEFHIWAIDKAGNVSAVAKPVVMIDLTAPIVHHDTITVEAPVWTNAFVTISGKVTDEASGVHRVEYRAMNEEWAESPLTAEYDAATGAFVFKIPEQDYHGDYVIRCWDYAGNESVSVMTTVFMDITKPLVESIQSTFLTPNAYSNQWTNGMLQISGVVKDDAAGIVGVEYRKETETWDEAKKASFLVSTGIIGEETTYTYSFYVEKEDYQGKYYVRCIDDADNISDEMAIEVYQDVTAPVVQSANADPATWTCKDVVVSGVVADEASGASRVEYRRIDKTWEESELAQLGENGNYTFTIPAQDYEGYYVVRVWDYAGNVSGEFTVWVEMDITKPIVNDGVANPSVWTNGEVAISGLVTDEASGIDRVEYRRADQTWEALQVAQLDENGNYIFTVPAQTYEGDYVVRTWDVAGNASDEWTVTVKMDIDAPSVTNGNANPAAWTNGDVVISGYVFETTSLIDRVEYRRADEVWEQTPAQAELGEEGAYTFTVSAQDYEGDYVVRTWDVAGNVSDEFTVRVKMDITAPIVTAGYADPSGWTNGDVMISGLVTDEASGVQRVEYRRADEMWTQTPAQAELEPNGRYSFTISAQDYEGDYVVRTWDNAGNVSAEYTVAVYMDVTAPIVQNGKADPSVWTNGDVVISGVVTDEASGINRVEYRRADETWMQDPFAATFNPETGEYTFTVSAQDYEGNYVVRTWDVAGNVSKEFTVWVKMDVTAPIVGSGTANPSVWTNGEVVISGIAFDMASDINRVEYRRADETWPEAPLTAVYDGETEQYIFTVSAQDYEGDYVIRTWDHAGNVSEEFTVAVKMDITAPIVQSGMADPSAWTNGQVAISGTVTDEASGLNLVEYRRADQVWSDVPAKAELDENGNYSFVVSAQDYEGNYVVRVWDIAGNVSKEFTVWVNMDITAPQDPVMELAEKPLHTVLEKLTFGYYQAPVIVNVTASDVMAGGTASGIDTIYYEYNGTVSKIDLTAVSGASNKEFDATHDQQASLSFELPDAFYGTIKAWTVDEAGNRSNDVVVSHEGEIVYDHIVVDGVAPQVDISFSGEENKNFFFRDQDDVLVETFEQATALYSNGNITATIVVTEDHFYADQVTIVVERDGQPVTSGVTVTDWQSEGNVHTCTVTISKDGRYTLKVSCTDYSQNEAQIKGEDQMESVTKDYASKPLVRDTVSPSAPEASLTYNTPLIDDKRPWTNGVITISGGVQDDFSGVVEVAYVQGTSTQETVMTAKTSYSFDVPAQDYQGQFHVVAIDKAGNRSKATSPTLLMDVTIPVVDKSTIVVQSPEWTNEYVTVTGIVSDDAAGIHRVEYKPAQTAWAAEPLRAEYNAKTGEFKFEVPKQDYKGDYWIRCWDYAGNESVHVSTGVLMDITKPVVESATAEFCTPNVYSNEWTNGKIQISGMIADDASGIVNVEYRKATEQWGNENKQAAFELTEGTVGETATRYTYTFTVDEDNYNGLYIVRCIDDAGNASDEVTVLVMMDTTIPQISQITTAGNVEEDDLENWTNDNIVVTIDVQDLPATGESEQIRTSDSEVCEVWYKQGENGEPMQAQIVKAEEQYTFTISAQNYHGNFYVWCIDYAGNVSEQSVFEVKMDTTAPTTPVIRFKETVLSTILRHVTFGFFKSDLTVSITTSDPIENGSQAGVSEILYAFEGQVSEYDETSVVLPLEGSDYTGLTVEQKSADLIVITFSNINDPKQFMGQFSAYAVDKAGNTSDITDKGSSLDTTNNNVEIGGFVVDSVAPQVTIEYASVDAESAPFHFVNDDMNTVETFEEAVRVYCADNILVTLTVTEGNFFAEDISVKVMKNGVFDEDTTAKLSAWTTEDITHKATLLLEGDGDYEILVDYTDKSTNQAEINGSDVAADATVEASYTSKLLVIDTTAPVIESVTYDNNKVINTVDGREYFDKVRTATIVINDHNFRADDIELWVKAQNVTGVNVLEVLEETDYAQSYYALGQDRSKWTAYEDGMFRSADDRYVLKVAYTADANYTFDMSYTDLAGNTIAADYAEEYFTVDQTAPTDLTVSYSTSVLETVINKITFGFYQAKMTVTITAQDETAGIYHFMYSYIKGQGVSSVNAQLLDEAIAAAGITYDGAVATTTFNIPKKVLDNASQFNGTVEFTAYDRSENSTKKADNENIVVDNIRPVMEVVYNEPVQNANTISYYNGNISVALRIAEANFYSEDVRVTITKGGAAYPVAITWTNESVDMHVGTFTLTEDGDYTVAVTYTDRSGNVMQEYRSNQLTIDTVIPTIHVSNVKHQSANADEIYSFTITADDTNINASTLDVSIKALIRNEQGAFEEVTISAGDLYAITTGKTYAYTVDNLEADAIYTMSCTVSDYAGHVYSNMILDDSQEYAEVQFSINRDGSVFGLDQNTMTLLDTYYIREVANNIVFFETNADPLKEYHVTLNGKTLQRGNDYTVKEEGGNGQWMKYTYTISKSLFGEEGEYQLFVSSTDKVGNDAFSDVKGAAVRFVVDRTAPILSFTGLEDGGRYQTELQTVTVVPTDDGGALHTFVVQLVDNQGNVIKELMNLTGDALEEALDENGGLLSFSIEEGLYQNIRILCADAADGENGQANTYDYTFTDVSVSSNAFMIFWANKPLRWGVIGGVTAVLGLIIFLLIFKRRKKDDKAQKA